ncbi:MAG: DNA mismatch repair protein MutS [Acidobacteria bacterium]|nr:DNA mismatch repair protein MutS [Acidobacteriota bacterium]
MSEPATPPSTPLMRQYTAIKAKFPQALLFFRLGDFYEMFFEDAVLAARELQITLTSRNKEKGEPIPMCGVPYHAADGYIAKLIKKGYKVAICEQMEAPSAGKKLVLREVTRVVTPGTVLDSNSLAPRENNFLASVCRSGETIGLASADLSTGEFRATEFHGPSAEAQCVDELKHIGAREVLFPSAQGLLRETEARLAFVGADSQGLRLMRTPLEDWIFASDYATRLLAGHLHVASLDGFGLAGHAQAINAAGALIHYLNETQRASSRHIDGISYYERQQWMVLDSVTVRNLELLEPVFAGETEATLVSVIDRTATNMGARLLKGWVLRPSLDHAVIESRLDAVEELVRQAIPRGKAGKLLESVYDLERLLSKAVLGTAGPRDLLALRNSFVPLPTLKSLSAERTSVRWQSLSAALDPLSDVRDLLARALSDAPPVTLADGGVIRDGYHAELDELRQLSHSGKQTIAQMESRERAATGINSLKIKFNEVFGYYIEVSKANMHLAPERYERRQTLAGAERYTTPELKDYERKVLDAEGSMATIEQELFTQLRSAVAEQASRIRRTAAAIAEIDVLVNFAGLAAEYDYCRPQFAEASDTSGSSTGVLEIMAGRHPVLERLGVMQPGAMLSGERFVPNDLRMDSDSNRILLITGPNMGGKSTYLRQVALISIMAQMGCFVPAASARLPVFDRIFTRIGASDNLARGRSTFMVEMTETAAILNTATPDSLIVLDEIGRGTATFDGLSIAWAVVEYLAARPGIKALFATHYHELTELPEHLPSVKNLHVAVKESGGNIVFLRRVEPGRADRSYGIEVARLAGLPREVIERAREVLGQHEQSEHRLSGMLSPEDHQHAADRDSAAPSNIQLTLFTPAERNVAERLAQVNVDELKPIEALNLLAELKKQLGW